MVGWDLGSSIGQMSRAGYASKIRGEVMGHRLGSGSKVRSRNQQVSSWWAGAEGQDDGAVAPELSPGAV